MHGQDDGERTVPLGDEEKDGDRLAVEAREAVQHGIDPADRAGAGEPHELGAGEVVDERLQRLPRAPEAEREPRAVGGEDRRGRPPRHDAPRRQRHLAAQLERAGVAQLEPRPAVLVRVNEERAAGVVERAVQVPPRLEHDLPRPRPEVVTRERASVAEGVRRRVEARGVGQPRRRPVLGRALVRRRVHDLPGRYVNDEEVGVARERAEPLDDQPAAVRRETVEGEIAAQAERPLLPRLEPPHDDLEVNAVAAVRDVGEQGAVARGDRRPVVEARIDDERLRLARLAAEVELRPLVAALVEEEQDAAVGEELPVRRLREVGELLEPAAAEPREEELPCPRQVRGDEQRGAVGRERERPRLTELEQVAE